jgi:hypothetical protein
MVTAKGTDNYEINEFPSILDQEVNQKVKAASKLNSTAMVFLKVLRTFQTMKTLRRLAV